MNPTLLLPTLVSLHALAAGPDITVGDLNSATAFGAVGDLHSYAVGFTACNEGDGPLDWFDNSVRHPVFALQLYRHADGRFEQIGLSWVFHEFFPLEINNCGGVCTPSGDVQTLGVGCGNVNSSGLGGAQQGLGPRTEVNPSTGAFAIPFGAQNQTGDAIYKRLRASRDDLETPGARFFLEGQYVALDDAQAGNQDNNASYREVVFSPGALSPIFTGSTVEQTPAIFAWADADPGVMIAEAEAPDGGRYIVASKAAPLPGGPAWRYEYAVYNMNSSRNAMIFEAPHRGRTDFPRTDDYTFHDADYHSGDPVDGADWPGFEDAFNARWDAQQPADNSMLPNEIRWGTLYNFGFTSLSEPVETTVRLTFSDGPGLQTVRVPAVAAGEARCSDADFAEPFFVLDLADIQLYIALFTAGAPEADLRPPLGVLDLADLQAFLAAFVGGCW